MIPVRTLKKSFVFLLLAFPLFVSAQYHTLENIALFPDSSLEGNQKLGVSVFGDYGVNASSVPNYFLGKAMYAGAYLDDQIKQTALDRLKARNRFGLDAVGGLNVSLYKNGIRYHIGLGHREFLSMRFTEDMFRLIFMGNKEYVDKTADVSNCSIHTFNYQYLRIGAEKKISDNTVAGLSLNLLRGGRYMDIRTKAGELFTEANGAYLDLTSDIRVQYIRNDTTRSLESNGIGTALDFYLRTQKGKSRIEFYATDLGFISWKSVKQVSGNSTFRYEGEEINDLLSPNSSIATSVNSDSVATNVGMAVDSIKHMMWLPSSFVLSWRYAPTTKMTHQVVVKYMMAPGYIPRLQYRNYFNLSSSFAVVNTLSYGGFGRGDYEIGALVSLKDKWLLSANFHALEYLLLSKKSSGNGLTFGITGMF